MRYGWVMPAFVVLGLGVPAAAATLTVEASGSGEYPDIPSAIGAAVDGDTVLVAAGEYVLAEPLSFRGKAIAVRAAEGPGRTVVRLAQEPTDPARGSVVVFEDGEGPDSILEGFLITGGRGGTWGTGWSERGGGGITCRGSSPTIQDCIVTENATADYGGGVYAIGGARPTLRATVITANRAGEGGGVWCFNASFVLENCLLSGNQASRGGGVYSCGDAHPVMVNCTVADNRAGEGGGVYCAEITRLVVTNCILWDNAGGSMVNDHDLDMSFSCVQGIETWMGETNVELDPLFVSPGSWDDGDTSADPSDDRFVEGDYRLREGSPAIDAGTPSGAPATDLDGTARPCGEGIDIGAYEYCDAEPPAPQFMRGEINMDGGRNIADAVSILSYIFAAGPRPRCLDAADANDDGRIDIGDPIRMLSILFLVLGPLPLPPPYASCGVDPTADGLDCMEFPGCARR